MDKQLVEFVEGVKSNKQLGSFDEAATKQAIVSRLLFLLGWDIFNVDEVNANLANETQQADYALNIKNTPKVFLKVVRPKEALDRYQEKVFEYAVKKGVEFAVLTNGVAWWFYFSANKGSALQKRFLAMDFLKQNAREIEEQLSAFLKRDEISKGSSLKGAKDVLDKRQQKAIPEAWGRILSEPHATLVKLIAETAEKLSGISVERKAIVKFLSERVQQPHPPATQVPHPEAKAAPKVEKAGLPPEKPAQKSYEGQSITSFSLKGKIYKVKSWEELLVKLCDVLRAEYRKDIDSLQWHSVGKKYYFNTNPDELRFPAGIAETDIYVETYLNPNEMVKIALSILSEFKFAESDFKINN